MNKKEKKQHKIKPSQKGKKAAQNKKDEIYRPVPKIEIRQTAKDSITIKTNNENLSTKFRGKKKNL